MIANSSYQTMSSGCFSNLARKKTRFETVLPCVQILICKSEFEIYACGAVFEIDLFIH